MGPESVEVLDTLSDGRLLDQIYGYEAGWGFPSAQDQRAITAIMSAVEEEETQTQGPPETSEDGERSDDAAGERPPR